MKIIKNYLFKNILVILKDSITKKHFPLEDDIISKIVQNQEPVHLNEISPSAELRCCSLL